MNGLRKSWERNTGSIIKIDKIVTDIKLKEGTSAKKETDIPSDSAEGGAGYIYRYNNVPIKFTAIYYGETGKREEEFFIHEKKVVKIVDTIIYYEEPIYASTDIKIASQTITNYYLVGDGLFRLESGNKLTKITDIKEYDYLIGEIQEVYRQINAE